MPTDKVTPIFAPTKSGASSIVIEYDAKSDSYEQKMLGIFIQKIKSNNNTLTVEPLESFSDGKSTYEIKVLGS